MSATQESIDMLTEGTQHPQWAQNIGTLLLKNKPIKPEDLLASFSPKKQAKIVAFMDDAGQD